MIWLVLHISFILSLLGLVRGGKRGVAWPWYNEGTNLNTTQLESVNVQWIYNWETWRPSNIGQLSFFGTQRCGDCASSPIAELQARATGQAWTTVFTLNEPDLPGAGAMSPIDAAQWYIKWINPLNMRKAVPSITSSGAPGQGLNWLDGFIAACAGRCYIDYINLHWYGQSFEEFKAHIEGAHARFPNYQIVVTEFSLLAGATREAQVAFLNSALVFLDNTTYVEHVCRLFRDVVEKNTFLQYLLELDLFGYSLPLVQRHDLSHAEKTEMLQARRNSWKRAELSQPFFIPFKPAAIHSTCFVDGKFTFACGYKSGASIKATVDDETSDEDNLSQREESSDDLSDTDGRGFIRLIHFNQLPSRNRGSGHKRWEHDLGFNAVHFTIYPDQDLLVILEQVAYNYDENFAQIQEQYKIHLQTMSTNEVYPVLPSTSSSLEFDFIFYSDELVPRREDFDIQIYGDLLAVELRAGDHGHPPYIEAWNWASGQNLARATLQKDTFHEPGFTFISNAFLIAPFLGNASRLGHEGLYPGLGGLDIYHVLPANVSGRARAQNAVAKLLFPKFSTAQDYRDVRLYAAPVLASPAAYPRSHLELPGKIYGPAPESYVHLQINVSKRDSGQGAPTEGSLVISTTLLAAAVTEALGDNFDRGDTVHIPWQSWRHCTCYLAGVTLEARSVIDSSGVGVGFAKGVDTPSSNYFSLFTLDFNPHRLRAQKAGRCESVGNILPATFGEDGEEGDQDGVREVLEQTFMRSRVRKPWCVWGVLAPGGPVEGLDNSYTDVKVDAEYVVFVTGADEDPDDDLTRGVNVYEI